VVASFSSSILNYQKRTARFGRLPLGEKGVGRFAAHKLGNLVEVVTKNESSTHGAVVSVDWREFGKDEYLDRISRRTIFPVAVLGISSALIKSTDLGRL